MEGLSAKDLQIFREKSRAFLGSVRIPLDKLQHEELPENPRQRDDKNIARLVDVFHKEGCQRRESDNHVPVLIPRSAVPELPRTANDDFQLFTPDHVLTYLEGRHRIEAARKFLTGNERWWVSDLYSDDLSLQVKNVLREHDPNCAKYYDGDILRQIRISTIQGDTARREKFLARLSNSKQDCVKRLELLPEEFWDSLDALIPFAGLWPAIFIGAFPRLLNLHCPEEMTRYLRRVKPTLVYIMGENENDWHLIDPNTFYRIQGRCPGLSFEDRADLQGRMLSRELLPAIQDDNIRSQILERLCSIKHVITTIHTFLEDTKYLEPCTRILKKLLPGKSKGSLSQYFRALRSDQPNVKVQTTEFTSEDRTFSGPHASWVSYRVLWLLTLRHFPVMDGQAPRRDVGKHNTWQPGLQLRWWVELSTLALENGHRRIRQLYRDRKAADISMIEDCVRRILPSNYYKVDQELMRRKVQLIYQIIGDIARAETVTTAPELTSDHENGRPDASDRCGRPRASALQADEGFLFFDHIYSTSYDTTPKRYLTSFAVTRDFFHSFFGTAEDELDRLSSFRLPRYGPGGDRQDGGRIQDIEGAEEPPVNQRPSLPPEVPLPPNPTGSSVENVRTTTDLSVIQPERRSRSLDRHRKFIRRGRSASPITQSHRSERQRERSSSRDRQGRREFTNVRSGESRMRDSVFPGAVQQLTGPPVAATVSSVTPPNQSSGSLDRRRRGRSASPTTPSHRPERRRDRSSSYQREKRRRRDSGSPRVENTPAEEMEVVQWVPPPPASAGLLVETTHTTAAARSRSLNGRRSTSRRSRSASPTRASHRSERRRERSTSPQRGRRQRQDSSSPHVEAMPAEEMEVVQWVPPPPTVAGSLVESGHPVITPSVSSLPSTTPMYIFGQEQEIEERTISFQDATRLLFRRRTRIRSRAFMVLSAAGNNRFRIHEADSTNTISMVNALQLPSETPSVALARDQGKRLKLNAPAAILDGARSQRLDTALVVSKHNAGEIIRQFEDSQESTDELRHKGPHRPVGLELVRVNGKPIMIQIWHDGDWKIAEKNVTEARTEEKIKYYMLRYRGLRPYDWEGHALSPKECFSAAQSDYPEAVYLCRPQEAGSILPIEL